MAVKTKAKPKMPAKKTAPPARKPAPAAKSAPARRAPVQTDIEDEQEESKGTLDITAVLAGCPTDVIVEALLAELTRRVDYVIEEQEDTPENVADLWLHCKKLELHTIGVRRALEDALVLIYPVDEEDEDALEGTTEHELEGFTVKIARKLTRSVDADKLTELSEEYEIDDEIARLFRFKPELNLAVYRAEAEELRELFAAAITTKPARPSITIIADDGE